MSGDGGLRLLVNPAGIDAEAGPGFLARCFASPWTEAMYHWYLKRCFDGEAPDRLVLMDGVHAVAGCGVVYRQLRTPDGELHRASVMVAACTLPSARGRGCYARVLEAAAELSAARGCAALLAFVTAHNATGRGFQRLGAAAIQSAYIVSRDRASAPGAGALTLRDARVSDDWPARAAARAHQATSTAGFHYPDAGAWRSQMVDRPHGVESVAVGATCRAVIEAVGDTDRLQWLDGGARERLAAIRALAVRARCRKRQFFMYSTCPHEAAAARRLGLAAHPGYMMALALQGGHTSAVRDWGNMPWRVQSGDRM